MDDQHGSADFPNESSVVEYVSPLRPPLPLRIEHTHACKTIEFACQVGHLQHAGQISYQSQCLRCLATTAIIQCNERDLWL